jgi:uncharacterized delta-60 repeat protein
MMSPPFENEESTVTGVAATGAVGTLASSSSQTVALTGVSSTSGLGVVVIGSGIIVATTGVSSTSGVGSVTVTATSALTHWISFYDSTNADYAESVAVDSSDNIIFAGRVVDGTDAIITAQLDDQGNTNWVRKLDSAAGDRALACAVDSSDNVVVAGYSFTTGTQSIYVSKYNFSGALQWQRLLAETGLGADAKGIATDTADAIFVAGQATLPISGNFSTGFYVAKYNSSGGLEWQRTLNTRVDDFQRTDIANAVAVDSSSNAIVVGRTDTEGAGEDDVLIAKYSSLGTLQWQRRLGGAANDEANAVAVDASDNIVIVGTTSSDGAGNADILVAKYNSSGTLLWDRTLGGSSIEDGTGVTVDATGNIYVTGWTFSQGPGTQNIVVAKYNSSGTIQWQRILGTTDNQTASAITLDVSGDIVIAGTLSASGGVVNQLIVKLPADGSGTGTYGPFTYSASTLTEAAAVLTAATSFVNTATPSLISSTASLTNTSETLTETQYGI